MAKDYSQLAQDIVANVGGKENIATLTHCVTRLRMNLHDKSKLNMKALGQLQGVIKVMDVGGQIQVVIGNHVTDAYDAVVKITGPIGGGAAAADDANAGETNLLGKAISIISGLFTPLMGAFTSAGLVKVLCIVLTTFNILSAESSTYRILYAAADAMFTFLPIALAITAAKKFNCNQFVAFIVAAALVYPDISAAFSAGESFTFLGIPVVLVSYTSTVFPAIAAVFLLSVVEKFLKKVMPKMLAGIFLPMLCILICVPVTFLVIGPATSYIGSALAAGYTFIMNINAVVAGVIVGFFWPCLIIFGLHWGFVPIVTNNLATLGYDTLFVITGPNNMAQAGACLGVFLKTKNAELKTTAGSAALSGILAGVTEPAIYGVNLKYKKPFVIGMIFSGIAGGIVAAAGTRCAALVGTSLLTLPAYLGVGFVGMMIACAIAYLGSAIVTYFFGFNDSMIA